MDIGWLLGSWATCRQGRLRGRPGRRFGRGSALLFLVGGCLVGTKPFTQKAVIDDCLDMLALSTRNIKCDETALIDTGHSRS